MHGRNLNPVYVWKQTLALWSLKYTILSQHISQCHFHSLKFAENILTEINWIVRPLSLSCLVISILPSDIFIYTSCFDSKVRVFCCSWYNECIGTDIPCISWPFAHFHNSRGPLHLLTCVQFWVELKDFDVVKQIVLQKCVLAVQTFGSSNPLTVWFTYCGF